MSDETKTEVTEPSNQEKMIPQSEVDRIISQRLARDKDKYSDYDDIKSQLETLQAEKKEREEAALSASEKLQKSLDEVNLTLSNVKKERDEAKKFKEDFEAELQVKIDIEKEGLSDSQKSIIEGLPLLKQMDAINEFKNIKLPPGEWGKGGRDKTTASSAKELHEIRKQYGAHSPQYKKALDAYKKDN